MEDFTGREIKHNDLVVSKPGGRYACMQYALIRDELASVWFCKGSWGGSDIIRIDTKEYPDLEAKRLKMIAEREQELVDREISKKTKATTRIKKKDLQRFGIYDGEILLGKCIIEGKEVENVWMDVHTNRETKYNIPMTRDNVDVKFDKRSWLSLYPQTYRTVIYPQKFKELCVFTEEEMTKFQAQSLERMKGEKNYSNWHIEKSYIQVVM